MNEEYLQRACEIISDRMLLVNLAAQRSRELARSSAPMVSVKPGESHLDVALHEIAENKLTFEFEE